MSLPTQNPPAPRNALRRVAAASLAGNAIEYYDFSIYGLAAALAFPQVFFPQSDPFVPTLAAFGTLRSATSPAHWAPSSLGTSATRWAASRCSSSPCS